ncbi:lipopolysaccharide export system permease protein [Methylomagnum ishizawai]|uniref:Lipopolysaccharide export system permease protein LptF n=1 Tax=Methylomagnum ishizawai TaxID=1760988 RepID=A0A1Y6CYE7_9GAMM|nr:lipopolysaccharide export system permease protein [Methylomagnum ishizawai]
MFAVIDRMVASELAKTLFAILLVLVVIIVSRKFLNILAKAIEGEVSGDTLFQLLGLKTLSATAVLLPPATFMAILTVIGRMYRDHEMAILASAGVGASRLYRALAWMAVPVFLLSGYLALDVMPWSEQKAQALMKKDEESADIRGIKPGRFNEFSSGDTVLYAESMDDDNLMTNMFVQRRLDNGTEVTIADHGHLQHTGLDEYFVVLNDGRRYQGKPGQADYIVSEFGEYAVRIPGPEEEAAELKREAKSTLELIREWTPKELAELQKRLAVPLGVVFLTLLAVPLARVAPRRGPYGNVFTAFLIYVVYENLQKISQGMLMTGKIPLWLSYSGIYTVLTAITLGLFLKNLGFRWFIHLFKRSA